MRGRRAGARFVAPVGEYLATCDRPDEPWAPLAIRRAGAVVGFAMWGFDAQERSHWVGGGVVDRAHQRQGVGRAAMERIVAYLAAQQGCREVALSVHPANAGARRLYAALGFAEAGETTDDGELVARLTLARRGFPRIPAAVDHGCRSALRG